MKLQYENFISKSLETLKNFESEADLTRSALTLDGVGVNGSLQYVVLNYFGPEKLGRFNQVNLISGSLLTYLCRHAYEAGELPWNYYDAGGYDKEYRSWHDASLLRVAKYFVINKYLKKPLFENNVPQKIYAKTLGPKWLDRKVLDLPKNVVIWLYDKQTGNFTTVSPVNEFKDKKLIDVFSCAVSIPFAYGRQTLDGKQFGDPSFAPGFKDFLRSLGQGVDYHLVSNLVKNRRYGSEIYFKTHPFGDGRKMISNDLFRLILNLPNPRIEKAVDIAWNMDWGKGWHGHKK